MVDARLPTGERVNVIIPPLALRGPTITIRRFPRLFTLEQLVGMGSLDGPTERLLRAFVRAKLNIVISGGTGAGKTTLLNALSAAVPAGERIITVEDSAELRLQQPHIVALEARPAVLHHEHVARRQLPDLAEDRARAVDGVEGEEGLERVEVELYVARTTAERLVVADRPA